MWDLPRPGLEPVSPALAGRFSTTVHQGSPEKHLLKIRMMKASPFPSSSPIFLAPLVQASGVELQGGCKRRVGFSSQPWLLVSDDSCRRSCSAAGRERLEKPPQTVHVIYLSLLPLHRPYHYILNSLKTQPPDLFIIVGKEVSKMKLKCFPSTHHFHSIQ